jgi:penicillin-binding protein 1A
MRLLLRFLGFLFATATLLVIVAAAGGGYILWKESRDLPDYTQLKDYEPPVMTRLHAADGSMIAEYAKERRLFVPIESVSPLVIHAFISAEDKNFFNHNGIDLEGIIRAALSYVENYGSGRRPQGASTITQQVAKNFLLSNKLSLTRKIKEALLAMRMEQTFSKDKILELYLNEIYLGRGNYGIAAAALNYFGKSVDNLTLAQAAYLGALPKAPSNYDPFRDTQRAIDRRNWVIDRMVENGYATPAEGEAAKKEPLGVIANPPGEHIYTAEYFAEEVRRTLYDRYGEKKLYEGGLSVRTSLDPKLQEIAKKALTSGLVRLDEARGWRGPVKHLDSLGADWGKTIAGIHALDDIAPWQLAVVLSVDRNEAKIGLQPPHDAAGKVVAERETGTIPLDGLKWAKWASGKKRGVAVHSADQVLDVGDVVYVAPMGKDHPGDYELHQVPKLSGAIVVMDPFTGRVLAMVGGFSYDESEFNRASQALRQVGSSFKPIIYAAAIDNGYTPSSIVLDAPIEIDQGPGQGVWKPENYEHDFYGPRTLRFGLQESRNVMTVRLAQDIGMPMIAEYARRFGVYDDLPPFLSMALGAGETTLLRMVTGYSMFDNGGKKITASLIDRVQDRYGHTIYRHDTRTCTGCNAPSWNGGPPPTLADDRPSVIDQLTAYQVTSMLENVVEHGTGYIVHKTVGKPIAGKTGTTNDYKDAWFIGYSPNLAAGVYIGYDQPHTLGRGETGGRVAAPIFADFMKDALKDKPPTPFRVPPGIQLVRVNAKTGIPAAPGDKGVLEAFKPGTEPPPDSDMGIGSGVYGGQTVSAGPPPPVVVTPDADRAVSSGTGGLY